MAIFRVVAFWARYQTAPRPLPLAILILLPFSQAPNLPIATAIIPYSALSTSLRLCVRYMPILYRLSIAFAIGRLGGFSDF